MSEIILYSNNINLLNPKFPKSNMAYSDNICLTLSFDKAVQVANNNSASQCNEIFNTYGDIYDAPSETVDKVNGLCNNPRKLVGVYSFIFDYDTALNLSRKMHNNSYNQYALAYMDLGEMAEDLLSETASFVADNKELNNFIFEFLLFLQEFAKQATKADPVKNPQRITMKDIWDIIKENIILKEYVSYDKETNKHKNTSKYDLQTEMKFYCIYDKSWESNWDSPTAGNHYLDTQIALNELEEKTKESLRKGNSSSIGMHVYILKIDEFVEHLGRYIIQNGKRKSSAYELYIKLNNWISDFLIDNKKTKGFLYDLECSIQKLLSDEVSINGREFDACFIKSTKLIDAYKYDLEKDEAIQVEEE